MTIKDNPSEVYTYINEFEVELAKYQDPALRPDISRDLYIGNNLEDLTFEDQLEHSEVVNSLQSKKSSWWFTMLDFNNLYYFPSLFETFNPNLNYTIYEHGVQSWPDTSQVNQPTQPYLAPDFYSTALEQVTLMQAAPEQAMPMQAAPEQATPVQATPIQAAPIQASDYNPATPKQTSDYDAKNKSKADASYSFTPVKEVYETYFNSNETNKGSSRKSYDTLKVPSYNHEVIPSKLTLDTTFNKNADNYTQRTQTPVSLSADSASSTFSKYFYYANQTTPIITENSPTTINSPYTINSPSNINAESTLVKTADSTLVEATGNIIVETTKSIQGEVADSSQVKVAQSSHPTYKKTVSFVDSPSTNTLLHKDSQSWSMMATFDSQVLSYNSGWPELDQLNHEFRRFYVNLQARIKHISELQISIEESKSRLANIDKEIATLNFEKIELTKQYNINNIKGVDPNTLGLTQKYQDAYLAITNNNNDVSFGLHSINQKLHFLEKTKLNLHNDIRSFNENMLTLNDEKLAFYNHLAELQKAIADMKSERITHKED